MASAHYGGKINIWDVGSGRLLHSFEHVGDHVFARIRLNFSPVGYQLASSSCNDATVKLWDFRNGRLSHNLRSIGGISSVSFNRKGHQVASGSSDGTVRVWDPMTGNLLTVFFSVNQNDWITTLVMAIS